MTPAETAELLGLCAAFDRRTIGKTDVLAWQTVLADVDFTAAKQAVTAHYAAETRWIMPADIRQAVRKQRAETAADYQGPGLSAEIPDADPDDVPAYLAALRAQKIRAADGLKPRPVAALLGRAVHQLTAGGTALEEPPASVRRPGPLGVACPTCGAAIGRPCKTPALEGRDPRERPPHAARKRAALADQPPRIGA
ncbi:zinc finger domain-containing protein [Streptomyces sp. NPDC001984]